VIWPRFSGEHDRPLQDRADRAASAVEDDRPGRARNLGMGRLVQPSAAALSLRRSPFGRVRADEGETDNSMKTVSEKPAAVHRSRTLE